MVEVKPTCHCGCTATESGKNGKEVITSTTSEAFAGWLHHEYATIELTSAGVHIFSLCNMLFLSVFE